MTAENSSFCAFAQSSGCKARIVNIIREYFPEPPRLSWVDRVFFRDRYNALRYGYTFNPQMSLYLYFGFDSEELEDILTELSNGDLKKCEMIFNKSNQTTEELMMSRNERAIDFEKSMTAEDLITILLSIQDIID